VRWILALLIPGATAFGGPILTYTFTGTATGMIGSTPFTSAALTVSGTADASAVTCSAGICGLDLAAGVASFTIGGIGSGTFSDASYFFDNQNNGGAGFGEFRPPPYCCDTIDIEDSSVSSTVFASYNLQSAIGPIGPQASDPVVYLWGILNTSLGASSVTSFSNYTFQVTAAGVPEPSTFALLGAGLAGLVMVARRKRSRRPA